MLIDFFEEVRAAGVPATPRELLDLIKGLQAGLAFADLDDFYLLARTCLVKDEKYYDRFDLAFSSYFKGIGSLDELLEKVIPDDWLRQTFEKFLSEEDRKKITSLGSLEALMEQFKQRLEEQQKRHAGGSKWIGTGGTSPFGHGGYHPEGIRVGGQSKNRSAVKVWEKREFKNFDDSLSLGNRNIQVALKRLRQFARTGAAEELDLDGTIRATARNAGYLDLKMVREKHNSVKVLLLLDVGGSMDDHIEMLEELFTACRTEFKHLEHFYFHNCLYESVWKDNNRRFNERIPTMELLHKYGTDYKVIFVGDAAMSPYEIAVAGGSVEHMNQEAGQVWLKRVLDNWNKTVWLNPTPEKYWGYTHSIGMIHKLVEGKMFPLTLEGLDAAMKELVK
ncbi:MAG TPA: VWA domain-containing protein [Marinospirillum sp.]|uniref:vWA domain-containing protein n=1 Tax=Marinospirillum sp. TaxID=2183934 RepID=UPI002B469A22|nr:VWA domain-containing protein [Marinospirillum sp.]HKM14397.1 VWA domain-containing protein [Marinospirillum sp.]